MWQIKEHDNIKKICKKLPHDIVKKYELWKNIVFRHGPDKLRDFKGLHDEKLKGEWMGWRSSRLGLIYRVIYKVRRDIVAIFVQEITPHKY